MNKEFKKLISLIKITFMPLNFVIIIILKEKQAVKKCCNAWLSTTDHFQMTSETFMHQLISMIGENNIE